MDKLAPPDDYPLIRIKKHIDIYAFPLLGDFTRRMLLTIDEKILPMKITNQLIGKKLLNAGYFAVKIFWLNKSQVIKFDDGSPINIA